MAASERRSLHTVHEALRNQKVSSLMITGAREWDQELINDIFDTRDASLILAIPLNNDGEDS